MVASQVSFDDIETAFLSVSDETEAWFDRVKGEVILITEDTRATLDSVPDELSDWEREEIARARRVLRTVGDREFDNLGDAGTADAATDAPDRYVVIPATPSHEAFRDMEEFVATLPDSRSAFALTEALRGGKPFRRFKETLSHYPQEQDDWYQFRDQRLRARITAWANEAGITLS